MAHRSDSPTVRRNRRRIPALRTHDQNSDADAAMGAESPWGLGAYPSDALALHGETRIFPVPCRQDVSGGVERLPSHPRMPLPRWLAELAAQPRASH